MSPKVSIVVTCYNLGAYVQEALDSIAAYTGPAQVEVIVVDDGSTEAATRAVISGLDRSRCTVLEQSNMGLAKARNNGIALATGSYIISLDADNRIHPAFIERSIAILDQEPEVGVVYGDAVLRGPHRALEGGRFRLHAIGAEQLHRCVRLLPPVHLGAGEGLR
ncbi:MAG: glycosyltransferase family 2 protein [Flavobacteriales bacterium]|nr:glycosyltransferase family 2 protein [Flavobacteriales bacterium]